MKRRAFTSFSLAVAPLVVGVAASPGCASSSPTTEPGREVATLTHVPRGDVTAVTLRDNRLVATLPSLPRGSLARHVDVSLPRLSDGEARLVDEASGMTIRIGVIGARPSEGKLEGGRVVYRDALGEGAHLAHRVHDGGTEDYVVLPAARRELRWSLALEKGVAGVRLLEDTLELLDAGGAPRLRMEAPYVVDARGRRLPAAAALHGCAADTSPMAPWGRPVTAPGSTSCEVSITLPDGLAYPVTVDPSWINAGTLVTARSRLDAVVLKDGHVFLQGGYDTQAIPQKTAELFDADTKTFAAAGSAKVARAAHHAVLLDDGRVFLIGGHIAAASTASTELYDPATGTYTDGPPMAGDRGQFSATKLSDGRVLVIGGCTYDDNSLYCVTARSDAEVYDPKSNAWSPAGDSKTIRILHSTQLLPDGSVLVVGGLGGAYDVAERWKDGVFTALPKPLNDLVNASASITPDGSTVVLAGGLDGLDKVVGTVALFDVQSATFSVAGSLQNPRNEHASFNLTAGVTVIGGHLDIDDSTGDATPVNVPEALADPSSGWAPGPTMLYPHSNFAGVVLPSGFLLVAGGEDISGVATKSAELFGDTCTDDSMCGTGYCSPSKVCATKKDAPAACTTKNECGSGNCVDGVCCDTACLGQCQACDGDKPGQCGVIKGKPHGTREACLGSGETCGGSCNGVAPDCAFAGVTTACGTCSNGHAHVCDGKGTCPETASKDCAPYVCGAADCTSSCSDDTGCASGYTCGGGKCVPKAAATCKVDHLMLSDGTTESCVPYVCTQDGKCLENCDSSSECSAGNTCNSNRVCAAPPAAGGDSGGGGCGCTVPGATSRAGAGIGVLLAGLLALRRRRPRKQA